MEAGSGRPERKEGFGICQEANVAAYKDERVSGRTSVGSMIWLKAILDYTTEQQTRQGSKKKEFSRSHCGRRLNRELG